MTPYLVLFLLVGLCQCDHYLILHPFYAGSHVLTLHSVTRTLVSRGHRVTTVRFGDQHDLRLTGVEDDKSFNEIYLHLNNSEGDIPFLTKGEKARFRMPMELLWNEGLSLSTLGLLPGNPWKLVTSYCHQLLSNQDLLRRLEQDRPDVVIVDLIYNECALALAHHLDAPAVGYWAFSFSSGEAEMTSAATPPSHIPGFISELTDEMTFPQRVLNFGYKAFARSFMWYHTYVCDSVIRQYFEGTPSSRDLLAELSGALLNTDNILDYPRLQPETFLNIGGIQISEKPNPLPKAISDFISGADHGVILMTMGFIFNPAHVPAHRVDALLNAFARLPQRVIVKFDSPIERAPSNVMVLPFVPQQDILAHEKTVLFFTHCGMHGVMEAIYHRVPMVGMPVFIDQGDVRVRMEEKGVGLGVSKMASEEEIYQAIVKVRDDKSYRANVNRLSSLMRLRRHRAMDDAVWLLEYVAKTKGADHLKLGSRRLNLAQYLSLDVLSFLALLAWLLWKALGVAFGVCCAGSRAGKRKRD